MGNTSPTIKIILFSLGIIFGYFVGYFVKTDIVPKHAEGSVSNNIRETITGYHYIAPLLTCDTGGDPAHRDIDTEKNLRQITDQIIKNGEATTASIYPRHLNTGQWSGVDEERLYDPASMLKIVLMITYLKEVEEGRDLLSRKIAFTQNLQQANNAIMYSSTSSLEVGSMYTVEQLIKKMIIDSDNGATFALIDHVDQETLNNTYAKLGLPSPETMDGKYKISAKQYSLFLEFFTMRHTLTTNSQTRP